MGACCSCCGQGSADDGSSASEMEMRAQNAEAEAKVLSVARGMSAPSIEVVDRTKVSGQGLALAAAAIEQDAAYWEIHVERKSKGTVNIKVGVATKKDRKFYTASEECGEESSETTGTALMSTIAVANGNVIGVTVQQSDLPMVQFFLNGQATAPEQSINRFRGVVYPAVYLSDEEHDDNGTDGHLSLRFVFHETDFRHAPPSSRFCPVMVARGLV